MSFFKSILDLIFPPRCVFCRAFLKKGEQSVCVKCEKDLPYTGRDGAVTGDFFTVCVTPLFYEGKVRDSLLRFKFREATGYASCYGALVASCVKENLSGKYDLITWVPLSSRRLKKRGYDQAMLLAMSSALALGDVAVEVLRKHTDVPAQSGIGGAEKRRANVSGAYEVIDAELIAGKRILLIDDIVTTGSTLSECARMMLMSGAESVYCAALARTHENHEAK